MDAGLQCRSIPLVCYVAYDAHSRRLGTRRGAIRRPIVNDRDLVGSPRTIEGPVELCDDWADPQLLIVGRNNDRDSLSVGSVG